MNIARNCEIRFYDSGAAHILRENCNQFHSISAENCKHHFVRRPPPKRHWKYNFSVIVKTLDHELVSCKVTSVLSGHDLRKQKLAFCTRMIYVCKCSDIFEKKWEKHGGLKRNTAIVLRQWACVSLIAYNVLLSQQKKLVYASTHSATKYFDWNVFAVNWWSQTIKIRNFHLGKSSLKSIHNKI